VRYIRPTRFDVAFNGLARRLVRVGVSFWGARELRVVGRRSGEVRSTVVNLLELDGERFIVAPRGETQWVRNLRAAGGAGDLRTGRRAEAFVAEEVVDDDAKGPVLAAYLDRWAFEVRRFFADGTEPAAFPVFRIRPSAAAR
jgi:deazaflavin-dependent oxidoreductase (nitroreductase family)